MSDYVTHKECSEKCMVERNAQDDARHDQTNVINARFILMEEKLDKIIDAVADLKVCVVRQEAATMQNAQSLIAHMVAEEKTLEKITKSIEEKVDTSYVSILTAIAVGFGAGMVGVALYLFSEIEALKQQISNIPQEIVQQIEQKYFITK